MNQIGNIHFNFTMQSETFARNLYGGWERFFALYVEPVAEEVLTRYSKPNEQLEIARLELELGTMLEGELEEQFPLRLRRQLEEALLKCLHSPNAQQAVVRQSSAQNAYQLLCRFLLHGSLPWSAQQQYGSIAQLFLQVLQSNAAQLKQFLQTYGHYTSLQERLVYQLHQPELEEGVRLLAPSESVFIISYIRLLVAKYRQVEKPAVRQSRHTVLVWKVVYAYLLTNRSSYFNKKSFVQQTLVRLSASYNTGYEEVLQMLCGSLSSHPHDSNLTPELFRLLHDLNSEADARQLEHVSTSPAMLYKSLSLYLQSQLQQGIGKRNREALIRTLSQPDSCRSLLQLLGESEIISLVPIVTPNESSFVVEYAHQLDRQKERGTLQGKAGSEFVKLKWQFIFTLLLSNTGATFNRKYFVQSVLVKIAAHYNLSVFELLSYFYKEIERLKLGNSLRQILVELYSAQHRVKQTESLPENPSVWVGRFKHGKNFQAKTIERLWNSLADAKQRNAILYALQEDEHHRLITLLLKQHSELVLSYAVSLDKHHQQGILEGKAGSEFRQLKWVFIWTVLTEIRQAAFNQKQLVSGVIQHMAARYNLSYMELLGYFHASADQLQLTTGIRNILNRLYDDEQQQLIQHIVQTQHEESIRQLLLAFYPKQREQVWQLAQWLHSVLLPQLSVKSPHGRKLTSVWEVLFRVLGKYRNRTIPKLKLFAENVLQELAKYYRVSIAALAKYSWLNEQHKLPAELLQVLSEVYHKLTGSKLSAHVGNTSTQPITESKQQDIITIHDVKKLFNTSDMTKDNLNEATYVNNAGLVLVAPFLPRLFDMLGFTADGKLKDREAQIRAMFVIQYVVFEQTEFPEYQMTFNKLLTGFETGKPIPLSLELTDEEKKAANSVLNAVLQHWEKLKHTSLAGLREGFLQREGKLQQTDRGIQLTVESKAYDMLLDSLPWSFSIIKWKWMKDVVHVKWR